MFVHSTRAVHLFLNKLLTTRFLANPYPIGICVYLRSFFYFLLPESVKNSFLCEKQILPNKTHYEICIL